ncbi:MAG: hypothetical protein HZB51_24735 [Chloroflexi bacterium]|nr:hypothetical protein [Chloroflexota bacterium]
MTEQTVYIIWISSIVLLLVVTTVVALLLWLILRTVNRIQDVVGQIWIAGQGVANNTIQIPLLATTNRYAAQILDTAKKIVGGAAAIEQHAEGCPGCPTCALTK